MAIFHRFPTAGRALPCGIVAASCGLPGFAFGVVPGGVSRSHSGRCARGGSVVRFLPRAVLLEVGEDGADGGGLFAVGSSMLATIRTAPPQWPQVLRSMLTKSPGAIWNSRKAGPKGGAQDARSNTRLRRCA